VDNPPKPWRSRYFNGVTTGFARGAPLNRISLNGEEEKGVKNDYSNIDSEHGRLHYGIACIGQLDQILKGLGGGGRAD